MSLQTTLAAGRRAAEARMTSVCRVTRLKLVSLDTQTLLLSDTDPTDDTIYEGPCRLKDTVSRVQTADFEGQLLAGQQLLLYLPVATSAAVTVGDMVEILDGGEDPGLVGVKVRVQGRPTTTQATAHRYLVELLT